MAKIHRVVAHTKRVTLDPAINLGSVIGTKVSVFTDKVKTEDNNIDRDRAVRARKREIRKNVVATLRTLQTQAKAKVAEITEKPSEEYSMAYYEDHDIADDHSLALAEGFENLLRTMAGGVWREKIFASDTNTAFNCVEVLIDGKVLKMLLTGGDFSEMLANIQIHNAGLEVRWTWEHFGFSLNNECWISMDAYHAFTDWSNPLLEASCEKASA